MDISFELSLRILYFVILAVAFMFGAVKLFRKGTPMYFSLYVMAGGCLMLERFISAVLLLCRLDDGNITAAFFFGTFSFSLFILSANRGTLDGIVDDRGDKRNRKVRFAAFAAPAVLIFLIAAAVIIYIKKFSAVPGLFLLAALIPTVPASYYNLKHLLLPIDEIELLRATRGCNIFALAYEISDVVFVIFSVSYPESRAVMACGIGVYMLAALLVIAAIRGNEKWEL